MGVLKNRLVKLAASSREYLEPGENPLHAVVAEQLGGVSWSDAIADAAVDLPGGGLRGATGYTIIATERHLYLMPTSSWSRPSGVEMKLPIERVDVHLEKAFLGFRPDLNINGTSLTTMLGGKKAAKALVKYVNERRRPVAAA